MSGQIILTEALLLHYPWDDSLRIRKRILDDELGPHWYFRCIKAPLRARFHQLMDNSVVPRAFLFGSPHIDNYAKTDTGCGMIDFDRAYIGPYAWDLVCLILSVSLRQEQYRFSLIDSKVLDALLVGYTKGLVLGDEPFSVYKPLSGLKPKKWQKNIDAYIQKNKKWAKKMSQNPVPSSDPLMVELMQQYLQNLSTVENPKDYQLVKAGRCLGSLGRVHNILLAKHRRTGKHRLIDMKHTCSYHDANWLHDKFYISDFDHDGKRMITASECHAPGVTADESYATVNGVQYWGRSVPLQNEKIKKNLNLSEQLEFCYAVGTQLGKSHGQSGELYKIQAHVTGCFADITEICQQILHEIEAGWFYYQRLLAEGPRE